MDPYFNYLLSVIRYSLAFSTAIKREIEHVQNDMNRKRQGEPAFVRKWTIILASMDF